VARKLFASGSFLGGLTINVAEAGMNNLFYVTRSVEGNRKKWVANISREIFFFISTRIHIFAIGW